MISSPPSIPRPSSRSERLLWDTLRRDETRRTHGAHSSRPRSSSSDCGDDDDNDDDDFFQSAILSRCSSRRNSAASALGHSQPASSYYIPDRNEHASYSRLLRSSSYSGSSRSAQSNPKSSPRPAYTLEKQVELSHHHDSAPHEAVLRNRLDSVMHSMRIDKDRDLVDPLTHVQSPTGSLASSIGSLSNSRTHSHESYHSHQTHLTIPDPDPSVPPTSRPKHLSSEAHRYTQPISVARAQPTSPSRTSASPRASTQSPRIPRAPRGQRSPSHTPTQRDKEQLRRQHPDSPWMYPPLPPSPPVYSTSPSKRAGPAVVTFVANPPMVETHAHMSACSPDPRSSMSPSSFDPEAASHALRQLPGYVSFASVAGLGAPPEEEDRRSGRRPITGFTVGGRGRLSGLGLGSGKWWIF